MPVNLAVDKLWISQFAVDTVNTLIGFKEVYSQAISFDK